IGETAAAQINDEEGNDERAEAIDESAGKKTPGRARQRPETLEEWDGWRIHKNKKPCSPDGEQGCASLVLKSVRPLLPAGRNDDATVMQTERRRLPRQILPGHFHQSGADFGAGNESGQAFRSSTKP